MQISLATIKCFFLKSNNENIKQKLNKIIHVKSNNKD